MEHVALSVSIHSSATPSLRFLPIYWFSDLPFIVYSPPAEVPSSHSKSRTKADNFYGFIKFVGFLKQIGTGTIPKHITGSPQA